MLPRLEAGERLAVEVWDRLGGLDWAGLAFLIEVSDLPDPEALMADLLTIRNARDKR